MPKRSRSGAVSMPARVVAPTSVNRFSGSLNVLAYAPRSTTKSICEILHRRVEELLDDAAEAMDLVDEEHVALLEDW